MKKVLFLAVFTALTACKKEEPSPPTPPPAPNQGSVELEFMNRAGAQNLQFGTPYVTASGDTIKVSKFNYYISNVVLLKDGGGAFAQPESYFVVRHPSATRMMVKNVPPGTYTALKFIIGVDSTRNCSGAQTGGLDVATNGDMFWSWNTGYIFMKLEGTSPQSPAAGHAVTFHVGGFKGPYKAQREVTVSLSQSPLEITDKAAKVVLNADILSVLDGPHAVSLEEFNYQMQPGAGAGTIADNYSDMISLESVVD